MQFSAALAAVTAAVLTSASPVPTASGTGNSWLVTNWEGGCGRSGCYAYFNVSSPALTTSNPPAPAFITTCWIFKEGGDYSECTWRGADEAAGRRVVARLLPAIRNPGENTIARFEVSFQYPLADNPNAYYNWTAQGNSTYNQSVEPPKTFNIPVTKIFGIA